MNNRFKQRLMRVVCMATALFSALSFSGCSDLVRDWNDLFSLSVSSESEDSSKNGEDSSQNSYDDSASSYWLFEESSDEEEDSVETITSEDGEESTVVSAWNSSDEEESSSSRPSEISSGEEDSSSEADGWEGEDSSQEEESGAELPALDFSPSTLTTKYGYEYFTTQANGEEMQNFYNLLYNTYVEFYNLQEDVEPTTVNYTGGTTATVYQIGEVNFGQFNLSTEEAITVWSIALLDFPEFYWISHKASYTNTKLNVYIDEEYAEYSVRQTLNGKLQAVAQECYSYLDANMSETERALTIQDYILANMTYAYESDGVTAEDANWAHNIEGITLQSGVCESYAKTYDYLCELMGLECITVTGVAGEGSTMGGHAWNIVKIDGVWHNVDTTWEGAYENPTRAWIGVPNTEFVTTHVANTPANGYGNTWLYALPTVSEQRLQPVTVAKNGSASVMYPNLDTAFASMQDETATYAVNLCPETSAGKGEGVSLCPYNITFTTREIPVASNITLTGKYVSSTVKTTVTAENAITVSSSLKIEYGSLKYPFGSTGINYIKTGTRGSLYAF